MPTTANQSPVAELLSNDLYRTLLQDILANPMHPVSVGELSHFNPGLSIDTIREGLEELRHYGILNSTARATPSESDDSESFHYLSVYGTEEIAVATEFLESVKTARKYYENVDSPKFNEFENMSRPDISNNH